MPFYIIGGQPVFLSLSRHQEIKEKVLKTKSATHKVASVIAGFKESKEAKELIYDFLRAQYDKNPEQFYLEWVHFDIVGDNASKNVWDLLYDYCVYYRYGNLSDLRDFEHRLIDNHVGNDLTYPMGQVFALNYFVKPRSWWWKYVHKMSGRSIRVVVVSADVYRLVGDLTDFIVYAKNFHLRCGRDFAIFPSEMLSSDNKGEV